MDQDENKQVKPDVPSKERDVKENKTNWWKIFGYLLIIKFSFKFILSFVPKHDGKVSVIPFEEVVSSCAGSMTDAIKKASHDSKKLIPESDLELIKKVNSLRCDCIYSTSMSELNLHDKSSGRSIASIDQHQLQMISKHYETNTDRIFDACDKKIGF